MQSEIKILVEDPQIWNYGTKSLKEALETDKDNGDTLWKDSIAKEMTNNCIAFERFDGAVKDLIGYEESTGHLIFDIKLSENFRRKSCFWADGHKVETPVLVTYSTVVSCDLIQILLMVATMNNLDVQGCNMQNAFLTADNLEKYWIQASPKFRSHPGKIFIVK